MAISQRIELFYKHLDIKSLNKFSTEIGITQSTVRDVFKKDSDKVSSHLLLAIKNRYPQCNLDWIITGEGEMIVGKDPEAERLAQELKTIKRDMQALERMIKRKDFEITELEKDVAHLKGQIKIKDETTQSVQRRAQLAKEEAESLKREIQMLRDEKQKSSKKDKEIS